ncbi:MAG: arsinothricin resistance N-acetyltransferase ArsN1 family B [Anaerolineales bacterium]
MRLATAGDAEGIHAIYAPIVRDTVISFELEAPSVREMRERVTATQRTHPWLVCEVRGAVAGYAYASSHRTRAAYQWAADVSVYNHEEFRGRGVGRALYTALFDILREQGFRQACAGIALPNEPSVGLHEAMGFRPVGVYRDIGYKLGAWHPVGWWQLSLTDDESPPSAPTPFASLAPRIINDALRHGARQLSLPHGT